MAIVLAYETARTYYRLAAAGLVPAPKETSLDPMADARSDMRSFHSSRFAPPVLSIGELEQRGIYPLFEPFRLRRSISENEFANLRSRLTQTGEPGFTLRLPLDVLVAKPSLRGTPTGQTIRPHLCSISLPARSFRRIGADAFIVSPELLFLEMAHHDGRLHAAIAFGCELCGDYSLLPREIASVRALLNGRDPLDLRQLTPQDILSSDGYIECEQRTTVEQLTTYITSLPPHIPGLRAARTALRWVKDESRSPMETLSSLQLRLPRLRGGFGAGDAQFNVRCEVSEEWRQSLHKPYLVVDELFSGYRGRKVALEYNGGNGHSSRQQVMSDNLRRHALEAAGLRVTFITARDFRDFATWDYLGEELAAYLGKGYDPATAQMLEARKRVHADLTDPLFLK